MCLLALVAQRPHEGWRKTGKSSDQNRQFLELETTRWVAFTSDRFSFTPRMASGKWLPANTMIGLTASGGQQAECFPQSRQWLLPSVPKVRTRNGMLPRLGRPRRLDSYAGTAVRARTALRNDSARTSLPCDSAHWWYVGTSVCVLSDLDFSQATHSARHRSLR